MSSMPKAVRRKLKDLVQDMKNANKGSEYGLRLLDDSVQEDGLGRGILLDRGATSSPGTKRSSGRWTPGLRT